MVCSLFLFCFSFVGMVSVCRNVIYRLWHKKPNIFYIFFREVYLKLVFEKYSIIFDMQMFAFIIDNNYTFTDNGKVFHKMRILKRECQLCTGFTVRF